MAAATVDSVVVRLDADLGPLRRGLRRSQDAIAKSTAKLKQNFQSMGKAANDASARIGKLQAGLIALGAVAVVGAGKKVADLNAEFQDLELTLQTVFGGVKEGEAAMDFIMEFAQRTPFDIQTLSKAFIQLGGAGIKPTEKLLTTFGDAAAATTNRVAAFEAMVRIATRATGGGLGLEELEQLVTQGIPVYTILQDELGKTRTELSEMGMTAEGARKIMEALQVGLDKRFGGGMERASKNLSVAMSNMGIAFTELGRALGDGVAGVGLTGAFTFLADTLGQVFVILKPIAHLLGGVLAAAIYAIVAPLRLVTELILGLGRAIVDLIEWAGDMLPDSWTTLKEGAKALSASLADLEAKMNANIAPVAGVNEVTKKQGEHLKKLNSDLKEAKARLAGYSQAQIDAWKATGEWDGLKLDMSGATPTLTGMEDDGFNASVIQQSLAIEEANKQLEANEAFKQKLKAVTEELRLAELGLWNQREADFQQTISGMQLNEEQIQQLWEQWSALDELKTQKELDAEATKRQKEAEEELQGIIDANVDGSHELKRQIKLLKEAMGSLSGETLKLAQEALGNLQNKLDGTVPFFEKIKDAAKQAGDSLADNIAAGLMQGKLSMDTFMDFAKGFIQTLIAEFIRMFIIRKILGSFISFGAAGGGTVPAKASGGRIPALASGGKTAGGGPILVGERGPELFVPGSAGSIKNNMDTKNILGGGQPVVVQQTINIETGVSQTVRAEMMNLLPTIKADTMNAVAEARLRGGAFASAFGA